MAKRLNIITGLILFAFVTVHLTNLAISYFSAAVAEQIQPVLLFPFTNPLGSNLLIASAVIHVLLGLLALYKRNSLQMSTYDTVQFVTALLIPLLLIPHAWYLLATQRLLGIDITYADMFYQYWVAAPLSGLRQVLLVLIIWIHGCIGLFTWLGLKLWWPRVSSLTQILAVAIPVLALLAFVDGGKRAMIESNVDQDGSNNAAYNSNAYTGTTNEANGNSGQGRYSVNNSYSQSYGENSEGSEAYGDSSRQSTPPADTGYGQRYNNQSPTENPPDSSSASNTKKTELETNSARIQATTTFIQTVESRIIWGYFALLIVVLIARAFRLRNTGQTVEIHYGNGEIHKRPVGLNFLEIAHVNNIQHANLCRGRGRCGTCRIRILRSSIELDPPSDIERETLARTDSAKGVRLACQLTPGPGVIAIEQLLPANIQLHQLSKAPATTDTESPASVTENP